MNTSLFIAKRFFSSKKGKGHNPAIKIAIIGIALGLSVMIISVAIALGFKHQVSSKVIGIGGHLQIINANSVNNNENIPFVFDENLKQLFHKNRSVDFCEPFSDVIGILKTNNDFKGILLRGIDLNESKSNYLKDHIVQGTFISNEGKYEIVISEEIAKKLALKVGEYVYSYFFYESVKTRKFKIVGIYKTNMAMFDDNLVFTKKNIVNKLNGWDDDECSRITIFLNDPSKINVVNNSFNNYFKYYADRNDNVCQSMSIHRLYSQIFNWLDLMDLNITFIIVLMIIVSGFTMVSGLLILILDRTNAIGILKAMGASNTLIQKIFIHYAAILIAKGMLWGNIIALAICFLQYYFNIIKLDPSVYYIDKVPIELNLLYFLLINIGTFAITLAALIAPSFLIARITPSKSIKFE